jgi:peptide/nickel transport system substrate-binding protein/oligopeptide transport system substrate-binding protein
MLTRARTLAWIVAVAALGISAAAVGADAQGKEPTAPRPGGVYRRPLANNPSTLDPALISDNYAITVAQQLFDGLVQYDAALRITPALAESWTASRDGLVWTFSLRKGVRFHTGRELSAEDVVYSFTRLLDPQSRSAAAALFAAVRGAADFQAGKTRSVLGIRALDRHTVQIELAEASAPFVAGLAMGHLKILPHDVLRQQGDRFGVQPVGTGPFRFVRWTRDREIVLEANPEYFGGRPHLDRLVYRIYPGQRSERILAEFLAGELEDSFIPSSELERVYADPRIHLLRRPALRTRFFGFTLTDGPQANRMVRQAFTHAIDREAIMRDVKRNRFRAGAGFLPPGILGFDPQFQPYPYDPARARALLAKAGYPTGAGLEPLQIWSSVRSAEVEQEHGAMRQYLEAVGFKVDFRYQTNWPEFRALVRDGKLPIFRYGWAADVPDPDNFLRTVFHSRGATNLTRYRNERVDRLLDLARGDLDDRSRAAHYQEAERLIMEDAPVFSLNFDVFERVFQPYVQNVEVSALGDPYIPMRKIWLAR